MNVKEIISIIYPGGPQSVVSMLGALAGKLLETLILGLLQTY